MVTSIVWAAAQSRCGCARGFGSITARARVERRVRAAADSARVAPAAAASPSPCPPLTQRRGALTPRRCRPLPDPPPHRPHHPPTSSHRLRSFGSIDDDERDIVLDPPKKYKVHLDHDYCCPHREDKNRRTYQLTPIVF